MRSGSGTGTEASRAFVYSSFGFVYTVLGRAALDDRAAMHNGDAIAHRAHDGEVMGDEQVGEAELALEVLQKIDDLRLDRDVERRHRLVTDDQPRRKRERAGDPDPLALPSRELVWIPIDVRRVEADHVEQLAHARPAIAARAHTVHDERLPDNVPDRHPRVQGRIGVLEHDLELAPHAPELGAVELGQLASLEHDRAAGRPHELENAVPRRRLPRAGLADEPDRLPRSDVEADARDGVDVVDGPLDEDAALDREALHEVADLQQRA